MLDQLSKSLVYACRPVVLVALALVFTSPIHADVISSFDSAGDVTLSPTQAPGTWYTDRYAPAGFVSGTSGGGRNGVLTQTISSADSSASRPGAFNSPFYNTQGRKYDLSGGLISAQIQMYVPSDWDSLNQSESGSGRLASFWATTNVPAPNDTYPIIEYNNNRDGSGNNGFRVWNPEVGGWVNVGGYVGDNQWYDLGFDINGSTFRYFVNGSLVYTDTTTNGSSSLANVILQGYNSGNNYTINWDNFSASVNAIPEPATLALFGLGALGVMAYRRRKGATASS